MPDSSISFSAFFFCRFQSFSFGILKDILTFPSLSFFGFPSLSNWVVTMNSFVLPIQSGFISAER